ncbi:hypothetical protein WJX74_001639 [Apatococcus lobatus]|uniref:D-isomer specific 2-hydroxyacid dehydrogenase NAD-binding domain-containing protein n=1 Tax=Apatococcus lobatus TaxID=904363 RepID=A0AAW1SAY4_9CHLO
MPTCCPDQSQTPGRTALEPTQVLRLPWRGSAVIRLCKSQKTKASETSRRDLHLLGLGLSIAGSPAGRSAQASSRSRLAVQQAASANMTNILIASGKGAPELELLKQLPSGVNIVAIGNQSEEFSDLTEEQWKSIDAVLKCGIGPHTSSKALLQELWPKMPNLKWIHSCTAGVEALLWPELIESDVAVTNARGAFSHSLAEWAITACSWFAKDLPRMRRNQKAHSWESYEVEELRNKTLGIVGYGDIGRATASIGRAFRMKVVALRRRVQLSDDERKDGLQVIPADHLNDLMSTSDYIVAALPHTDGTDKLISQSAIQAMKKTGVFINVGRGGTVDEPALIEALQKGSIRGAGLDVFATEPLPEESPLWDLDNVLLSPHTADRTTTFQFEAIEQWLQQVQKFVNKQYLANVVDKTQGY